MGISVIFASGTMFTLLIELMKQVTLNSHDLKLDKKSESLACKRYPGGHLVEHDHFHFDEALIETGEVLENEAVPAIFEAAFEYEGLIARADVIERLSKGGWRLIEVKSTTTLKDIHILDLAFQLFALRKSGLDVRECGVLTLDRSYVYDGKTLDLDSLFQLHDVGDNATALSDIAIEIAQELQSVIVLDEPPDIEPGDHCFNPYPCPYYGYCTRNVQIPEHDIRAMPRLSQKRRDELKNKNIVEIRDIPASFPLTKSQQIVRTAVIENREIANKENLAVLDEIEQPIRHLDFETFSPAIPRFAGTSPYDAIPFLFSVHIERKGLNPGHKEYLHEGRDDPRPQLAKRLIQALGRKGAICTYHNYEKNVIRALSEALPEYTEELLAIEDRLVDLLPLIRGAYYHPEFHGSFSLKSIFPVLCPDEGYDDLEIADGQTAAVLYMTALATDDIKLQKHIFNELREYCKRDTLATLKVRQALVQKIQADEPE